MSYKRVRPRNSKRIRHKLTQDSDIHFSWIPSSALKTFIEENPSADESAQIEAFLGQSMIPVFDENVPNLVNTSSEKMAEYKLQRQLIQKIKEVKRGNGHKYSTEYSGHHFSPSEPFTTVLIKVMSNLKPSIDDIRINLQDLGTIEDIVLYSDGYSYQMAFIRFESTEIANDLYINRKQIKLNYGLAKNVSIEAYPKRSLSCGGNYQLCAFMRPIDRQLVIERVRNSLESGRHFIELKSLLLMTETDRQNRLYLCHRLETILNNNQIRCKFYVFGSTVNELGFCDSDIDVFIEIFDENNFYHKMDSELAVKHLIKIREVLAKELRMFIQQTIRSRRCPLVKLDFRQFGDSLRSNGISCDLSLVDSLGIQNSKLIAFYCKLEPRFQTLAIVLRYLAKINGFIGSNQMSSYAFSMLIIFFCQNLTDPLLPTVDKLMELKTKRLQINRIECGFCEDVDRYRELFPNQLSHISTNYLFQLFFEFYNDFDFRSRVICPRNGRAVLKGKFDKYLERERITNVHEFQMKELICIQDPFNLTFNMTHHMPYKLFLDLKVWFKKVLAHRHQYFSDDYIPNEKTFADLLDPSIEPIDDIKKQMETYIHNKDIEDNNEIQVIERNTSKKFVAKLITNFKSSLTDEEKNTKLEDWALKVRQFFRILFRDGFKTKCFYSMKPKSKIRFNESTTFEAFVIKFNTIDRRIIDESVRDETQKQMKEKSIPLDFIKRETLITEAIVQNSEHCLIIDENSDEICIELDLSFEVNDIFLSVTDSIPPNGLTQHLIQFICKTFRSGLEAEQLLIIDDDIDFH